MELLNQQAADALCVLQQMTGSHNDENPWLGVVAAVALLQSESQLLQTKNQELEGRLDQILVLANLE
jgi:hypothetical protein